MSTALDETLYELTLRLEQQREERTGRCGMVWFAGDQLEAQCSRSTETFCGDCGVELCRECAVKVHMETYCQSCGEWHEKNDLTPQTDS